MNPLSISMIALLPFHLLASAATAEEQVGDPRGAIIEMVRNDQPSFMVRIDVERANRTYLEGEQMRVQVKSARSGYLYLIYCDADKNVTCLFPNSVQQDNRIQANQMLVIPPPPQPGIAPFVIRIGPPYGQEVLKAIVSTQPMASPALARLMKAEEASARLEGIRGAYVDKAKTTEWAEHHVQILTKGLSPVPNPGGQPAAGHAPRRVGVFIGISDFASPQIRDLAVSHNDALTMADVMKKECKMQQGWVLVNEQASRSNIEDVLRRQLPAATRAGDTVVIFWSGHGSRCADVGDDENDGFDEYLVPYDGQLDDIETIRNTMLLDDTFGRWIQELDGRRLLVILDTCHSGGQGQEKSLSKGLLSASMKSVGQEFDFLDGEFARIKDIGQRETALLASSMANQVSFERREGDLSTMTHFLVDQLKQGQGSISLRQAYAVLKEQVPRYVERTFPGTTQTPVLIENLTAPFLLRP